MATAKIRAGSDSRAQKESGFACLTYHALGENGNQYAISEEQFRDQLAMMRAEGYVVEGFEQLEGRLRSGEELPGRYVILTMDDGHASSMRAAELLEEFGGRGTFFLTRDRCLGRPDFVRAADIRKLREAGFSLGTHGTTHRKLTFLSRESCVAELDESKHWLEDVLGEEVHYLAAPAGFINSRVLQLAQERGYVLTGTCNEWMNSGRAISLPGNVNRVNIRRHFSPRHFRRIIQGDLKFYIWRQVRAAALAIPKQLLR
jgi:peptidoglycan/xylan/chitin deacetylase (PgdA/CDA1 family)